MPLCTKERIARDYATLNTATLTKSDGSVLRLYPSLLAFLLRLSSIRGGEPSEIAKRTKEVTVTVAMWRLRRLHRHPLRCTTPLASGGCRGRCPP